MYKSPITIIESTIDSFNKAIIKQKDDAIFAEIQHSFGVDVDRQELIRALKYDRDQYEKGYKDGKADATHKWIPVTERLPEHGDVVLCFMKFGEHRILQWDNVSSWWLGYGQGDDWQKSDVTHWSKMPQPPEGD